MAADTTVALTRSKIGTSDEHWALYFGPPADNCGVYTGAFVDVAHEEGTANNAPLEVDFTSRGFKPRDPVHTITPIYVGDFSVVQLLLNAARGTAVNGAPTTFNCADFTNAALTSMLAVVSPNARKPGLSATDAGVVAARAVYNNNQQTVRTNTDCNWNTPKNCPP